MSAAEVEAASKRPLDAPRKDPGTAIATPAPPEQALVVEALEFLQSWLSSQSSGQIDRYLNMYDHNGFKGIKRTTRGESLYTFKTWAADRRPMIVKRPRVTASFTQLRSYMDGDYILGPDKVELRFEQAFALGSYKDHGDKRLLLRRISRGRFQIIEEEMLNSTRGLNFDGVPKTPISVEFDRPLRQMELHHVFLPNVEREREGLPPLVTAVLVLRGTGSSRLLHLDGDVPLGQQRTEDGALHLSGFYAGAGTDFRVRRRGNHILVDVSLDDEGLDAPLPYAPYARVTLRSASTAPLLCPNAEATSADLSPCFAREMPTL